jgi:hypothetical protein
VLILLIAISTTQPLKAQYYINFLGYNIDTVYPKLAGVSDYERMSVYNELAFCHSLSRADSAIYYAELALELAEDYDDPLQRGLAIRNLGNAHALLGNYRDAVVNLHQALNIFENLGNAQRTGEVLVDLGKLNYDLEDYEKAMEYAQKFETLYIEQQTQGNLIASPLEIAVLLGMTAATARESHKYDVAITYFKQFIEANKSIAVPLPVQEVYVKSLAETFELSGQFDSALKYTYLARSYRLENQGRPETEHTGYDGSFSKILYKQGKYKESLTLSLKSYQYELAKGGNFYSSIVALRIGDIYMKWGMHDSSLYWYNRALAQARHILDQMHSEEGDAAQQEIYTGYQVLFNINQAEVTELYYGQMLYVQHKLYKYYEAIGDLGNALASNKLKYAYRDSLYRVTQNIEERRTQIRYESERMEQQVQLLEQEAEIAHSSARQNRIFLVGVSILAIIVILMVLLYLRQNRLRAAQDKITLQQRLFRSQMNPHFLYNSLASIQHFIVTEDADNASIYLSKFSSLVRTILEGSEEEYVTLEKELNLIENYLALQQIRFIEKLDYKLEIDDRLDVENIEIPPMLAQPFIENAIEHGIKHKKEKGNIWVRFMQNGNSVVFEVEDDGVGRDKSRELRLLQKPGHKSFATRLTQERIANLNRKKRDKITMEIEDLKDSEGKPVGTKVRFNIPF